MSKKKEKSTFTGLASNKRWNELTLREKLRYFKALDDMNALNNTSAIELREALTKKKIEKKDEEKEQETSISNNEDTPIKAVNNKDEDFII